jgi:Animal haem peroxidase
MTQHGSGPLRGLVSTQQSTIGTAKFGRMFRWLPPAHEWRNSVEQVEIENVFEQLAKAMVTNEFNDKIDANEGKGEFHIIVNGKKVSTPDAPITVGEEADENTDIPAGFTYFGQFIDHDITFDPASAIQMRNDPDALEDFRTPRFDLDCLYGRGPSDQPYLYEKKSAAVPSDRKTFSLGASQGINGMHRPDLPRFGSTALIGDKRNDENKIVSQIQALFLKFHNTVFKKLGVIKPGLSDDDRFSEAQRIVRWTYQYLVLNDFLKKICREDVYEDVKPNPKKGRGPNLKYFNAHGDAFIPVEFAVAAYRFGHSMVRPSYLLNNQAKSTAKFRHKGEAHDGAEFPFARIPIFVARSALPTDSLNGFGDVDRGLPPGWGIDWTFFFGKCKSTNSAGDKIPQPSYRIDSRLVDPLGKLPEFVPQEAKGERSPFVSLAFRNLLRGASLGLPSGQSIAKMMGVEDPMTDPELWESRFDGDKQIPWEAGVTILADSKGWLEDNAPLWFYILKEAEVREKGHRLGKVGSRIVAETFYGLAWCDHYSFLFQQPGWKPQDEFAELANIDMLKFTKFANEELPAA